MNNPCPAASYMAGHACGDSAQCFEPCGQLGHSEAHAQPAECTHEVRLQAVTGKIQIGPTDIS